MRAVAFICCLLPLSASALNGQGSLSSSLFNNGDYQLLSETEAFQIVDARIEQGNLSVIWQSARDYYLYRKNFKIEIDPAIATLGDIQFPQGVIEKDPLFGDVEVYFFQVQLQAPITLLDNSIQTIPVTLYSQGCNKPVGICYPPQKRQVKIDLNTGLVKENSTANTAQAISPQQLPSDSTIEQPNFQADTPDEKAIWQYMLAAFTAGLLLVFTPCVLPMLPILSAIIVGNQVGNQNGSLSSGQKKQTAPSAPSKATALGLSLAYVVGTTITYTLMGALAGAAGIQLQAYFQNAIMISIMAGILFLMALSMFGLFSFATSSALQSKVDAWTKRLSAGSWPFAIVLGLLSALVVSACVSPLLISFLAIAIQQANPLLGAMMMFAMSVGMGVLLVLFALGADWLIPKTGAWMNKVKELFGLALLAVAIYVLGGIKAIPILLLWSLWLFIVAFWLWQLASSAQKEPSVNKEPLAGKEPLAQKDLLQIFYKALAVIAFLWAVASFFGGLTGATQLTKPLQNIGFTSQVAADNTKIAARKTNQQNKVQFDTVTTVAEIEAYLQQAREAKQPVLVDYYADWCVDCVRMEQSTYIEPEVVSALQNWRLLKIDVTKTNQATLAAKKYFKVFGPPATLFINARGQTIKPLSRYGYIPANEILQIIQQVK